MTAPSPSARGATLSRAAAVRAIDDALDAMVRESDDDRVSLAVVRERLVRALQALPDPSSAHIEGEAP